MRAQASAADQLVDAAARPRQYGVDGGSAALRAGQVGKDVGIAQVDTDDPAAVREHALAHGRTHAGRGSGND